MSCRSKRLRARRDGLLVRAAEPGGDATDVDRRILQPPFVGGPINGDVAEMFVYLVVAGIARLWYGPR